MAIQAEQYLVDGRLRHRPRLAPCGQCGRQPEISTGYVRDDGTPMIPGGIGPYLIVCTHGQDFDGCPLLAVRSWNYDRCVAMWQLRHGRKLRRYQRLRRASRVRRRRRRGW